MATTASLKQTIAHVENWIRSGAAARDIEKLAQVLVKRASERIPPAALKRLIVVIERFKPLAERAAGAAKSRAARVAPLVKRAAGKKGAVKKAAARKAAPVKSAVKKAGVKKAAVKRVAATKAAAKRAVAKKAAAGKTLARKTGSKKAAVRRTVARKAAK